MPASAPLSSAHERPEWGNITNPLSRSLADPAVPELARRITIGNSSYGTAAADVHDYAARPPDDVAAAGLAQSRRGSAPPL